MRISGYYWLNGKRRVRWLDGFPDSMDLNLGKLWEVVRNKVGWHAAVRGVNKSQTWLGDWTPTTTLIESGHFYSNSSLGMHNFLNFFFFCLQIHQLLHNRCAKTNLGNSFKKKKIKTCNKWEEKQAQRNS